MAEPTVDDPGEINQREKIKQLNKARGELSTVRNRVTEKVILGHISEQRACSAYRQVVSTYIMHLAPFLRSNDFEAGTELWNSEDLGEVVIPAPSYETDGYSDDIEVGPPQQVYSIDGVSDLLSLPSPLAAEFQVTRSDELRGTHTETETKTAEIDRQTLDNVVIRLDEFRQEVGLGVEIDPNETTEWEI